MHVHTHVPCAHPCTCRHTCLCSCLSTCLWLCLHKCLHKCLCTCPYKRAYARRSTPIAASDFRASAATPFCPRLPALLPTFDLMLLTGCEIVICLARLPPLPSASPGMLQVHRMRRLLQLRGEINGSIFKVTVPAAHTQVGEDRCVIELHVPGFHGSRRGLFLGSRHGRVAQFRKLVPATIEPVGPRLLVPHLWL